MYSSIRSYCPLGGFQLLKQPLLVIQGHGTVHLCLLLDKHNVATVSCAWWAVCLVETPKWIHHFTGSICCFSSTLWELCRAAVNFDPWLDKKKQFSAAKFWRCNWHHQWLPVTDWEKHDLDVASHRFTVPMSWNSLSCLFMLCLTSSLWVEIKWYAVYLVVQTCLLNELCVHKQQCCYQWRKIYISE